MAKGNCKLTIDNCKLQIAKKRSNFFNLQLSICNCQFAIVLLLAAMPSPSRAQDKAPDFETSVLPVLTRSACNSGACHGAAIGRGGFKLSLLGYDPSADYDSLIHEYHGRRVHLVQPEKSLVLRKPTMQVPHEGGHKLDGDGRDILLAWIRAGAPRGPGRRLQSVEITPARKLLAAPRDKVGLQVFARFSDDSREDVTRWAMLTPTDPAALKVGKTGQVTALARGQNTLMVRFLGEVGAVSVIVPLHETPPDKAEYPRANFIDDHVNHTLRELHLTPSPQADDVTFVRRVFLDLIGTLPEPK